MIRISLSINSDNTDIVRLLVEREAPSLFISFLFLIIQEVEYPELDAILDAEKQCEERTARQEQ